MVTNSVNPLFDLRDTCKDAFDLGRAAVANLGAVNHIKIVDDRQLPNATHKMVLLAAMSYGLA